MRKEFLWDKGNDHLEQSDEDSRKEAKQLLREEVQSDTVRHLRRALGVTGNSSVDWIEVEEDGEMVRYDDQESIERKIMENNEKCFRLTETSPPMQKPLVSELGYLADTNAATQILQGTYTCPPGVDRYTQQFLASLQATSPVTEENQIPTTVMKEDYQMYWKRSRERTSSSYSTLHFGHWKANAADDYLSEVHATFTEIVISTGHSPTRWQKGLSVMLEKHPGNRRPQKLRAIALMEADFNFPNKLFLGKRMMEWAEKK